MSRHVDLPALARSARALRRGRSFLAALLAAMTSACAVYHPLPLAGAADLHTRLDQLDARLPPSVSASSSASTSASAESIQLSGPLSPGQLGMLAILNDPDLRALHGGRQLARAQLLQGALLPNPSASLTYEALLSGPGTAPAWAVSLSEDINALVTYRARMRSAHAQADQVDADQLWQQWQVAQQARLLGVDLYWAGQAIELSEREQGLIASEIQTVQQAVDAGNLDYTALAPLLTSQATLQQSLITLQTAQLTAWQGLDALLGLRADVRFALAPPPPPPAVSDIEQLLTSLPRRRPDLIALQLGYRSSDENVRAAILGQFPKFTLGPIWEQDTSNIHSAGPTATFDLPVFDRNQGQIAIARATRLQLQEQYQARLDAAVGQIRGLLALERRTDTDIRVSRQASQSADQLSSAAQAAYRMGNIDQRTLTDFQTAALERALATIALRRTLAETQTSLVVDLGIGLPVATLPVNAMPVAAAHKGS